MDIKKLVADAGFCLEWQEELELFAQKIREARDSEWMAEPVAWVLPTIPVRIVDHPDFNANYGGTVTPLFAKPKEVK